MSFLGVDMGEKRVGIAISDELGFMAHAEGFLEYRSLKDLLAQLNGIVSQRSIRKIVVGLPKTLKGEMGPQAQKVMGFVEALQAAVTCPVLTWDERLTTAQAERALIEQDVSRAKRRLKRDQIAAEIMLQSYLDFMKTQERQNEH